MNGIARSLGLLNLLALIGCTALQPSSTSKPAANASPLHTATQFGGWSKPGGGARPNAARVKTMNDRRLLVRQHISAVDGSVSALLGKSGISKMTRHDWRRDTSGWRGEAYSVHLWDETRPVKHMVQLHLSCLVSCDDGLIRTQVGPRESIRKPELDLRFDWFIDTGDSKLDAKVKEIAVTEADRF